MHLFGDFETYSELNVEKTGASKYSRHSSTEALCFAYVRDDDEEIELWIPGEPPPFTKDELMRSIFHAHNAEFEYLIWNNVCVPKYGWPKLNLERVECTAARCAALGLPRSLDGAATALDLDQRKDKEGHKQMQKLCKPKQPSKKDPSTRYTDWKRFKRVFKYCMQDVNVEREIFRNTPPLSEAEKEVWRFDFQINHVGVVVDLDSCYRAIEINEQEKKELNKELSRFTEFKSAKQPNLAYWFVQNGVNLPSTKKGAPSMSAEAITEAIDSQEYDGNVLRALEIRQHVARSSTAKFASMVKHADDDGRVRGLHLYHGGHTGRWASKLFQSQNMPGGWKTARKQYDAIQLMHSRDALNGMQKGWGSSAAFLKQCIRSMIVAEPGNRLVVCDFSGIENCVAAWLACEDWLLKAIRKRQDTYKLMAAKIYDVEVHDVTDEERAVGKRAVLGLGYGMGGMRFKETCESYNVPMSLDFAEQVKEIYRDSHPQVVAAWKQIEARCKMAIANVGGKFHACKGRLRIWCDDDYMWIRLPSGRKLAYYRPFLKDKKTPWGAVRPEIRYWGVDSETKQFVCQKTYGAKLFENVVQAMARDILVHGMYNVDEAGYEIVLHVHDEIVSEAPIGWGSIGEFSELMCDLPEWAHGCPIRAEGFETIRYRKAG